MITPLKIERGSAMFELLITMILVTAAISSALPMLQSQQRTIRILTEVSEATALAESSRQQLSHLASNGMADIAGYSGLADNSDVYLTAGTIAITPGSSVSTINFTRSWRIRSTYTDGLTLGTAKPELAPFYPIVKKGSVLVQWENDEGETQQFSLRVSRPHPLLTAYSGKLSRLNTINPG